MSQTATIVSCSVITLQNGSSWQVMYSYVLDSGGIGQASVIAPFWASPTALIAVPGPGTTNPVLLPCPPAFKMRHLGYLC